MLMYIVWYLDYLYCFHVVRISVELLFVLHKTFTRQGKASAASFGLSILFAIELNTQHISSFFFFVVVFSHLIDMVLYKFDTNTPSYFGAISEFNNKHLRVHYVCVLI